MADEAQRIAGRMLNARILKRGLWPYLLALGAVAGMTGLIAFTHADASPVNIPPLYLLVVQAVAVVLGSRAAVLASVLAFLAFDWYFVEPRYQVTVRDPFEFVALCVFLVTAILVGQLTALFQSRAQDAARREMAANALAKASWSVAAELNRDAALHNVLEQIIYLGFAEAAAVAVVTDPDSYRITVRHSAPGAPPDWATPSDDAIKFVIASKKRIDDTEIWEKALASVRAKDSVHAADRRGIYLPVISEGNMLGVLCMELPMKATLQAADWQVIDSLLNHVAVVLQRDKLMQAQAKAQALAETNRLKTALLQMVSHDFRSPLASIKASVSSLEEGDQPIDPQTQSSLLQAIETETDRLNRMVGNLLDLSRLEAHAWQARREPCSLSEMVGSTLNSFSRQDDERIEIALPSPDIDVLVDSVQMVQVLKNLLENALKYSKEPVGLKAQVEGSALRIRIEDRGPGLPPGEEQLVFEPFYRAKQHQESALPGVGMGLAVCRGLVEANGGTLTAGNREGGGAYFCVSLPDGTVIADENSRN